ncbi:MAG: transcriptional regulator [Sulfobacillus thermosulfidooxidans]|uniref:Transcriptional regulator n=1 Tax=Sulfobacillus thermotolerans TaxID=338644 RepID=A0ABN5GZT9_9FIRM|nr:transcriptional regulator [Sulfobacillus sp. hq2]AUW92873.1 transcriptional regulator [Sulfobacillus thermotolerans]MCY0909408.1 transcriptional regulator [Sulfobacillus thermotolerans]POB10021.1 transcriptional regulator [Sulfobacillus sp. hq2]PSR36446.1 MAG: transcriptional regulator [Sulfobacillus thermosulfidooxidans]
MDLIRIGDKVVSLSRITDMAEQILLARSQGLSQQDVARKFHVDRSFVSRLETVGELRKGRSIAVIGFPVQNTEEIRKTCQDLGVELCWVMTNQERWEYAQSKNGIELINEIMDLASRFRQFDAIILLASNARVRLMAALLDSRAVIPVVLGETPLSADVVVDIDSLRKTILAVSEGGLSLNDSPK